MLFLYYWYFICCYLSFIWNLLAVLVHNSMMSRSIPSSIYCLWFCTCSHFVCLQFLHPFLCHKFNKKMFTFYAHLCTHNIYNDTAKTFFLQVHTLFSASCKTNIWQKWQLLVSTIFAHLNLVNYCSSSWYILLSLNRLDGEFLCIV